MIAAGVAAVVLLRRRRLNGPDIVVMATTVVLAVPFVLPEMHERYFYLADVLTIVMAFYVRRYWPVAMVVSACSLLSYAPFLWQRTFVALPLVAFAEFLAVIATVLVFGNVVGPGGAGSWLRRPVPRAGWVHPSAGDPARAARGIVAAGARAGRTSRGCGSVKPRAAKAVVAASMARSTAVAGSRATTDPPNPPPVILAPRAPAPSRVSTARSNSGRKPDSRPAAIGVTR